MKDEEIFLNRKERKNIFGRGNSVNRNIGLYIISTEGQLLWWDRIERKRRHRENSLEKQRCQITSGLDFIRIRNLDLSFWPRKLLKDFK